MARAVFSCACYTCRDELRSHMPQPAIRHRLFGVLSSIETWTERDSPTCTDMTNYSGRIILSEKTNVPDAEEAHMQLQSTDGLPVQVAWWVRSGLDNSRGPEWPVRCRAKSLFQPSIIRGRAGSSQVLEIHLIHLTNQTLTSGHKHGKFSFDGHEMPNGHWTRSRPLKSCTIAPAENTPNQTASLSTIP
jgi:hypothetical protein